MSELYGASETAEPVGGTRTVPRHENSREAGSYRDAVQDDGYGSYGDDDVEAFLAAEQRQPESRTRQEAAADTWGDDADDPADSEYDGDVAALLATEQHQPESRTRQDAVAATWDDTTGVGDDDPDAYSGDPASEYDGDVAALLAAEQRQPEPRTRQEAAADTWSDTDGGEESEVDPNTDSAHLGELPAQQETADEAQPDSGPSSADTVTDSSTAPAQTDEADNGTLEPDTYRVNVHTQDGTEVPITVLYAPPEDRALGDGTPSGAGLKPTGEQLRDMEGDSMSRLERIRHHIVKDAEDVMDAAEEDGNQAFALFDHPPTGTHAEVPVGHPELTTPEQHGVDGGHLVTAGLVLGLLGYEAARVVRHSIDSWKGIRQ